jgi:hypothetical protein
MLCCVGLFGGAYVGQSLGGHWTITAPAVGFAVGLYGDMKLMREKTENPLLQGSDINAKEVRQDSG